MEDLLSLARYIVYELGLYSIGWVTLRVITFGHYPRQGLGEALREDRTEAGIARVVGLFAAIAICLGIGLWLHST